jgi:adenine-specific DNA methylase
MTPPSLLTPANLNKAPTNQPELKNLLESLNPYTPTHQIKLGHVKKTFDLLTADLVLARDATKSLVKANMARKARKKTKETGKTYRTPFGRVLTENEAIRLREDEVKKNEDVMQKKMAAKAKKSAAAEKKRIHTEEVAMRKRKREEVKIAKELKKASKPKRSYRRRLQNPPVPVFPALQMGETAPETEESTLQIEENEAGSPAPSMGGYIYQ